ncbi:MAG: alpha/beta hydrolase [Pseudomonadota bacterium]
MSTKPGTQSAVRHNRRVYLASMALPIALVAAFWLGLIQMNSVYRFVGWAISEGGTELQSGISYGPAARQKLDIYRPLAASAREAAADTPIILFVYGGSWRDGDRTIYRFVGDAFASRGYKTVIPDYRLYPDVQFPGFVNDVAATYRWIEKNLLRPGQKIILVGHSAGAHMSALVALDPRYLKAVSANPAHLAGWVGLAGPYAFQPTTWPTTKDVFVTASDADEPRPVAHVTSGEKPALLFHGLDDDVVKVWNMRELAKALRAVDGQVRAIELPGVAHIGIVLALARPFRGKGPVLSETLAFIRSLQAKN